MGKNCMWCGYPRRQLCCVTSKMQAERDEARGEVTHLEDLLRRLVDAYVVVPAKGKPWTQRSSRISDYTHDLWIEALRIAYPARLTAADMTKEATDG